MSYRLVIGIAQVEPMHKLGPFDKEPPHRDIHEASENAGEAIRLPGYGAWDACLKHSPALRFLWEAIMYEHKRARVRLGYDLPVIPVAAYADKLDHAETLLYLGIEHCPYTQEERDDADLRAKWLIAWSRAAYEEAPVEACFEVPGEWS